ncbi:hypothetical protein H0H93_005869 [Arthromyces matolae]|nr:hypothetical protein H0H93_005869 [Arthromyces matolae]
MAMASLRPNHSYAHEKSQSQDSTGSRRTLSPHPYQSYVPAAASYEYNPSMLIAAPGPELPIPLVTRENEDDSKHLTVHQTYLVHHHHHHHHHHPPAPAAPFPSPRTSPPLPPLPPNKNTTSRLPSLESKYRPLILLLLFLPLPSLLSVLYILVGHGLLLHASSLPHMHMSSSSSRNSRNINLTVSSTLKSAAQNPWSPSLLSSANAAATGGIILSIPLFLLLYILLPLPFPSFTTTYFSSRAGSQSQTGGSNINGIGHRRGDDFFEPFDSISQSSSSFSSSQLCRLSFATYLFLLTLLFTIGGIAAPLGVTCLEAASKRGHEMLSPARAAEAGFVGGVVLLGLAISLVIVVVMVLVGLRWLRQTQDDGMKN